MPWREGRVQQRVRSQHWLGGDLGVLVAHSGQLFIPSPGE